MCCAPNIGKADRAMRKSNIVLFENCNVLLFQEMTEKDGRACPVKIDATRKKFLEAMSSMEPFRNAVQEWEMFFDDLESLPRSFAEWNKTKAIQNSDLLTDLIQNTQGREEDEIEVILSNVNKGTVLTLLFSGGIDDL